MRIGGHCTARGLPGDCRMLVKSGSIIAAFTLPFPTPLLCIRLSLALPSALALLLQVWTPMPPQWSCGCVALMQVSHARRRSCDLRLGPSCIMLSRLGAAGLMPLCPSVDTCVLRPSGIALAALVTQPPLHVCALLPRRWPATLRTPTAPSWPPSTRQAGFRIFGLEKRAEAACSANNSSCVPWPSHAWRVPLAADPHVPLPFTLPFTLSFSPRPRSSRPLTRCCCCSAAGAPSTSAPWVRRRQHRLLQSEAAWAFAPAWL